MKKQKTKINNDEGKAKNSIYNNVHDNIWPAIKAVIYVFGKV